MNTAQNTHPNPIDGFDYRRIDIAEVRKHLNQFAKDVNLKQLTQRTYPGRVVPYPAKSVRCLCTPNNRVGCLTVNPIPCRMNNVRLAHLVKVDKRTILNHLSKLEKMGIVQKRPS